MLQQTLIRVISMLVKKIYENTNRIGYACFKISGISQYCRKLYFNLEKKLHQRPFLGEEGWQVSEHKFKTEIVRCSEDTVEIFLPKSSAVMLDPGNYTLNLFDESSVNIGSIVFKWQGIRFKSISYNEIENSVLPYSSDKSSDDKYTSDGNRNEYVSTFWADSPINSEEPDKLVSSHSDSTILVESAKSDGSAVGVEIFPCYNCKFEIFYGVNKCPFCGAPYKE